MLLCALTRVNEIPYSQYNGSMKFLTVNTRVNEIPYGQYNGSMKLLTVNTTGQ